ncbi:hypothetical protein [Aneurinibacillus aneurinilyticus]|uniref:hypothetical protein n=1 Tax=Aneurinibacillus aneurinilyticus TaxID=1391 RepID=UPI003523DAAF
MNLNKRKTTIVSGKEILYDVVGIKTNNVTLDATKFTAGIIPAGRALVINPTTKKAEPWVDDASGEPMLLFRDIRIDGQDVVGVGLVGGYVRETKCVGLTEQFKQKSKMLYFK